VPIQGRQALSSPATAIRWIIPIKEKMKKGGYEKWE
jgi:hypothetical protein